MNTVGDDGREDRRALRRYRIRSWAPHLPFARSLAEIHGWMIGHGEDRQDLAYEELPVADEPSLMRHTEVWVFLTATGEIVTAAARTRGGPSADPASDASPPVITVDWVLRGTSLPAAAHWCLQLLQQQPRLSVAAVVTAIRQARDWLDEARCSPIVPRSPGITPAAGGATLPISEGGRYADPHRPSCGLGHSLEEQHVSRRS